MTENIAYEQIEILLNEYIIHGEYLEKITELLNENRKKNYDLKENFMYHENIDSYFYITYYDDGSYHLDHTGKLGYERFMNSDNSVRLERKTKNLYPTYELLMAK